jgi:orotate phosphoribosyltransferase
MLYKKIVSAEQPNIYKLLGNGLSLRHILSIQIFIDQKMSGYAPNTLLCVPAETPHLIGLISGLSRPVIFIRSQIKEYGTGRQIEGTFSEQQPVVLVTPDSSLINKNKQLLASEGLDFKGVIEVNVSEMFVVGESAHLLSDKQASFTRLVTSPNAEKIDRLSSLKKDILSLIASTQFLEGRSRIVWQEQKKLTHGDTSAVYIDCRIFLSNLPLKEKLIEYFGILLALKLGNENCTKNVYPPVAIAGIPVGGTMLSTAIANHYGLTHVGLDSLENLENHHTLLVIFDDVISTGKTARAFSQAILKRLVSLGKDAVAIDYMFGFDTHRGGYSALRQYLQMNTAFSAAFLWEDLVDSMASLTKGLYPPQALTATQVERDITDIFLPSSQDLEQALSSASNIKRNLLEIMAQMEGALQSPLQLNEWLLGGYIHTKNMLITRGMSTSETNMVYFLRQRFYLFLRITLDPLSLEESLKTETLQQGLLAKKMGLNILPVDSAMKETPEFLAHLKHYSDKERLENRVYISEGSLYQLACSEGRLVVKEFSSKGLKTFFDENRGLFVLSSEDGQLVVGSHNHEEMKERYEPEFMFFNHTSMNESVYMAGLLEYLDHRLIHLSQCSGHYKPTEAPFVRFYRYLCHMGLIAPETNDSAMGFGRTPPGSPIFRIDGLHDYQELGEVCRSPELIEWPVGETI